MDLTWWNLESDCLAWAFEKADALARGFFEKEVKKGVRVVGLVVGYDRHVIQSNISMIIANECPSHTSESERNYEGH